MQKPEILLRRATERDIPLLYPCFEASVRLTCNRHYTEEQINAWIGKATPKRWKELMDSDLHFILAEDPSTQKAVGFTSINAAGYLHSMFICPAYQRLGIGRRLLLAAEEYARRFQAPSIHSEVSLTARPFFERMGYNVEREQTVNINETKLNNFIMSKQLSTTE